MTGRMPLAVGAVVIITVVLVSYLLHPEPSRAGQVVFIPSPSLGVTDPGLVLGTVTLLECTSTHEGLHVKGRVDEVGSLTSVIVMPGDQQGAGTGVGFRSDATQAVVGGPGSFLVTIPFASQASVFAVAQGDTLGLPLGRLRSGPSTRCPR